MTFQKVAVVTGSGQGIGAGCARSLAEAGFKVILMSPSERSVELGQELGGIGMRGSVLENRDLEALVHLAQTSYGRIDAVVNNVGHGGRLLVRSRRSFTTNRSRESFSRSTTQSGTRASTCTYWRSFGSLGW